MINTPKVIRRPQNVLIAFAAPSYSVYKLSQQDASRIEQRAGTSVDFLDEAALTGAMGALAVQPLPVDAEDRHTVATLIPPPPTAAPVQATPPPPPSPPPPAEPAEEPPGGTGLRWGLIAAIAVLALVLILAVIGLSNFFGGSSPATPTATTVVEATPVETATPGASSVSALANVSVHSGPDNAYPIIGVLPAGSTAPVVGRNERGSWWLVQAGNIQGNQGWVPDDQVVTNNIGNVPVATPPPLPSPTATIPQTFNGWMGEYYDNADLRGKPVVVQDDPQINFNWGAGAPVPGIPPNDYSVRWTRQQNFPAGDYRITVNVEGGVRLWLDNRQLINSWNATDLRVEQASTGLLAEGAHAMRVEYRKRSGNGQIAVAWSLIPQEPPVAVITGPDAGQVGQRLSFSASASTPPPGGQIAAYEWRFGDGTVSSQQNVNQTFATAGVYDVSLTVTAGNGLTSIANQQVTITDVPQPPSAIITSPADGTQGQPITFDGSASTSQSPIVTWAWSFDDGSTANGQIVQHAFAQAGTYNVSLTVTNSDNLSSTANKRITIASAASPTPTPVPDQPLQGTSWQLSDTIQGTTITALFSGSALSGNTGCNTYAANFQTNGAAISIGDIAVAGLVCSSAVMNQETAYLSNLAGATSYQIQGAQLIIVSQLDGPPVELVYLAPQPR